MFQLLRALGVSWSKSSLHFGCKASLHLGLNYRTVKNIYDKLRQKVYTFLEKDVLPEIEVDYLLAEFNSENKNPDILINAFLEINNSLIENIAKKYPAKNLKLAGLVLEKVKLIAEKKYYNFEMVERFGIKVLSLLSKDLPIGKLEYLESLLILAICSKRYATLARIRNWLYRQSESETIEFESLLRKYLEELAGIGFLQKLDREKLNPKLQEIIK